MFRRIIAGISLLVTSIIVPVVAAPAANAAVSQAFKVCAGLDGTGGCTSFFVQSNGSNFYEMPASVRSVATSINGFRSGITRVQLRETNAWGFGWGAICADLSLAQARHYITDRCNDDLGAVLVY